VHTESEEMALGLPAKEKALRGHGCVTNKSLRQWFGVSVDFHIDRPEALEALINIISQTTFPT